MRKTLNRMLACFLAVALLVSCCISGLVLPAAASSGENLYPEGDLEGTLTGAWEDESKSTVNATAGFGGGKAWEIFAGKSRTIPGLTLTKPLQAGKWYMLRVKQTGGKGHLYFSSGKYTNLAAGEIAINSTGTTWNEVSALFQVTEACATLPGVVLYNKNTDGTSVYYDDIAVYEVAAGVNLIPGGDGALPITGNGKTGSLLAQFSGVTVVDGAWQFGGLDAAGTSKRLLFGYLNKMLAANDELTVSFRYKGENATASVTAVNGTNGTVSNAVTTEADADGWKTYTANIKINNSDSYNWGYYLTFSGATEVLVDDFSLSKVLKTSIDIEKTTETVKAGETVTLNATVEPTDAQIVWTSSDDTIATVANGVVTGVKAGTVTITATVGDKSDTCEVTVTMESSIDITKATETVEVGKTVTLQTTVVPSDATITWTSSDDTVATVADGVVTGVKAGTVTITAAIDGGKSDTCEVTVTEPVPPTYNGLFPNGDMEGTLEGAWEDESKSTVNATAGFGGGKAWEIFAGKNRAIPGVTLKESLKAGKWYVLRFKQTGGKGYLYFSSGKYTNLAAGEIAINSTGTTWNEVSALFQVTEECATLPGITLYNKNTDGSVYYDDFAVYEYTAGVNLIPGSGGATFPITGNGTSSTYFGKFNGLSLATDGENKVWKFSGLDAAGTQPYLLDGPLNKMITVGDELTFSFRYKGVGADATVEVADPTEKYLQFLSTNTTNADANGWKTYTATVKVSQKNSNYAYRLSFTGATEVLVDDFVLTGDVPPEPEVDITNESETVQVGKTVTLSATTIPSGSAITWTSSDGTIATVENGVVKGVATGTVTITATIAAGKSDTCQVTVTAPAPPATSIKLGKTTMHLAPDAFKTLQVIATPAGNSVGTLTFTSNNTAVATVDENGKVTAVGEGEATITMTSSLGASFTDSCFVKVDAFGDIMIGGDFESDFDASNWSNYTAEKGQVVADPADANNHVLSMISKKSAYYKFGGLLQPNTIYRLSGKAKGDLKAKVILYDKYGFMKVISGQTRAEFYPLVAGDDVNEWKKFEVVLSIGKQVDQSYFMALKNDGDGEVYFDDIKMEKVVLPVTSLTMNEKAELGVGVTSYLNYKYEPYYGDVSGVQWTSSDASVATVDNTGKVTTLKEGKTTITVKTSDTVSASCVLTVVKDAKTFTLSKTELALLPNGSATLYTVADPIGATIPGTLAWSSSNKAVATVDQSGNVTAVANGDATITCTNGKVTVTCAVKVSENGELIVGGDFQNSTQNWAPVADGTNAQIVDDPYEFGNKVLVVNPEKTTGAYANLALKADTLYMLTLRAKGAAATVNINSDIVAKFYPAEESARKTVADDMNWNTFTIRFRTKAEGTLSDVLSFVGGKDSVTYIDDVSLVKLPAMTGITWKYQTGDTQEVVPDNSVVLTVAPVPSDAFLEAPIVWSTADSSIAVVDQNGKLTGVKVGNTTVTASVEGFAPITLKVNVDYYASLFSEGDFANPNASWKPSKADAQVAGGITDGIGLDGSAGYAVLGQSSMYYKGTPMTLIPGNKYQMTVRYKSNVNTHGSRYVWFQPLGQINFENTKGQWKTVTRTGTVTPNWDYSTYQLCIASTGSVATPDEGIVIDSIDIRMVDTGVAVEKIALSPQEMQLLAGETAEYKLTPTPSNANTNFAIWTSSNEEVVVVEYGKLYAVGAGTATVTVKVPIGNGQFKESSATVVVVGDAALIKNGTFENTTDTSWQLNGASIVAGEGYNKSVGAVLGDNGDSISQTVSGLKAGSAYTFRFRYSAQNYRSLIVRVKKADDSVVYYEKKFETSAAWKEAPKDNSEKAKLTFTLPKDYDGSALVIEVAAADGKEKLFVDNFILTEGFSKADLVASDIVWNDGATQIKPGTPVNFTVVIGNAGEEAVKDTQEVVVELRVNTKTIYTWTYKGGLDKGYYEALTTEEPWIAEEGEMVISAHVNTTATVREMNNKNNGKQAHIRVADEFLEAPKEAINGGFNKLVFSDDFDFLSIDGDYTGDYGYKWYLTDQTGITGDMSDVYLTDDGIMLAGKRMRYNWLLSTIDGETGAGWEGFTFGYLEYRSRFERTPNVENPPNKGAPAVWSFSHQTIAPHVFGSSDRHVEVDWMEYWGNKYKNGTWTVTLHDSVGDFNKQNMNNNPNHFVKGSYDENDIGDGEWHTVGYRWEKGLMICYLDGREIWRQEWGGPNGPNPPANVGAGEYRDDVFQFTDKQTLALLLAGGVYHPMELDYIRVWQSDGTIDAKPVLDNTFLDDYLTDENGEYFTEVTPDNYEAILDALFAWEELKSSQQEAINNVLKENGGKTYDELLFEAQDAYNTAEAFVLYYACDEYGDAYTAVDENNFEWILSSLEEWDTLSDLERAIINDLTEELCGMTFEDLLAEAEWFADGGEGDVSSPEDGVPFPTVAVVGLFLGGAAVVTGKKRREEEQE